MTNSEVTGSKPGTITRRRFFRSLVGQSVVAADELRGIPHYRLSELRQLPDQDLTLLKPALDRGVRIVQEGGEIRATSHKAGNTCLVCADTPERWLVLTKCDGTRTVGEIAGDLVVATGCSQTSARAIVREVFLSCTEQGLARPKNAPTGPGGGR